MDTRLKRVLVIEDRPNWQKLIGGLLQEVAKELGYIIEVSIADCLTGALSQIMATSYDLITVDNKLPDEERVDRKMAKAVLDRIGELGHRVPVVIISGAVDPGDVRDFFKEYEIDGFFSKNGFEPRKFKKATRKLLRVSAAASPPAEGDTGLDWNTIVSLAVSVVSPHAVALATSAVTTTGKETAEVVSRSIREIWRWIGQAIGEGDNQSAGKVWEDFRKDPTSNRDALVSTIRKLIPYDDTVLRGCVQGLIRDVELQMGARLYSLLNDRRFFTLSDLRRICSRLSPQWEREMGSDPSRETLARWVVYYASKRHRQQELIAAAMEINPIVMLQQRQ